MRILTALTYYAPHISGLTVYARRLVRRLVARGHTVTVLTAHFQRDLPRREVIDGATVVRSPVALSISKGVLMPLFPWQAARLIASHDLLYLHLPQFEASIAAVLAKALRKPIVLSYQCDIELPRGPARYAATPAIRVSHYVTGKLSDRIVVTSDAYGRRARLPRHFHQKVTSVHPPVELAPGSDGAALRRRHGLGDGPLVGFVGRYSEEKGIEYLIESLPRVLRDVPAARYVLAGPTATVPGERVHERLDARIRELGARWVHLGLLPDEELASFYRMIDVLVLPSTNSTESFGMSQAEAMLAGTPVVATDMPGVSEAVRLTGMGRLVPPRDGHALAEAIVAVLRDRAAYVRPEQEIRSRFDPEATTDFYERLFAELVGETERAPVTARS